MNATDSEKCGSCGSIQPCPINLALEHTRTLAVHGSQLEEISHDLENYRVWRHDVTTKLEALRGSVYEFKLDVERQINKLWLRLAFVNGGALVALYFIDKIVRW